MKIIYFLRQSLIDRLLQHFFFLLLTIMYFRSFLKLKQDQDKHYFFTKYYASRLLHLLMSNILQNFFFFGDARPTILS